MSGWDTAFDWFIAGMGGLLLLFGLVLVFLRPNWVPVRANEFGWRPTSVEVGLVLILSSLGIACWIVPKVFGASTTDKGTWFGNWPSYTNRQLYQGRKLEVAFRRASPLMSVWHYGPWIWHSYLGAEPQ